MRKPMSNFLGCVVWIRVFGVRDKDAVADAALRASQRLAPLVRDFVCLLMLVAFTLPDIDPTQSPFSEEG